MTPQAQRLQRVFLEQGESIVYDYVAFRTLNLEPIHLAALEPHLFRLGYQRFANYQFPEKKLHAWGYIPSVEGLPRIFISELDTTALSPTAQTILNRLCAQVAPGRVAAIDIFWAGRLWQPISWSEYRLLLQESEYAAWVAALGIQPNHFTLSVNHLQQTPSLESVLTIVTEQGIPLNESGGMIKGSPEVLLEQAATLADWMPVEFANHEIHDIPTCYYEFARRYPLPDGTLFPGFVTHSIDRIFESTNAGQAIEPEIDIKKPPTHRNEPGE